MHGNAQNTDFVSYEIQVEYGNYTRIHNTILEKLALSKLTGSEFRCLMFLFRKTYGFGKKEDRISLSQWGIGTGMQRQNVREVLQSLKDRRIIYVVDHGPKRAQTWGFNKYFDQWDTVDPDQSVMPEHYRSVMPQHVSLEESVMPEHDRSISDSNSSVMPEHDRSVMPQHYNKRKKEITATATTGAAAANSSPNGHDPKVAQFVAEYERIWGLLISSPYEKEKLESWAKQIPLEAWIYGLSESADQRQVGKWKYLESILRRLAAEGISNSRASPNLAPVPSTVDFSLSELLGSVS